jgi:hypothetical protein
MIYTGTKEPCTGDYGNFIQSNIKCPKSHPKVSTGKVISVA